MTGTPPQVNSLSLHLVLKTPVRSDKVIGSTTYSTEYAYNLASEVTQITYPSTSRIVVQSYDAIGRLCGVGASGSTCSSGTRYASGYNYNTAGEVTGFNYGNGVVTNLSYIPDRLQRHCLQYDTTSLSDACTKDSSALFMLTYAYGSPGANNGQISGITDGMDNGRTASYTYDGLGRLSTAATAGSTAYPAWGLSWTYDRYGNRTAQSTLSGCTGITCPTNSLSVSASTNQVTGTGFGYDAGGNMSGDGLNTLNFDAMNNNVSSTGSLGSATYSYDGKGTRVKKCLPNCTSPTTTTAYVYSGSRVIAEYDNGAAVGSPTREYIYSGGTLIAKVAGSTTTYYHNDHLSNRLVTSNTGAVVEQLGHFPFGETWYETGSDKWKFTTYERDPESGNDYALARYQVNRLGRFASPDPVDGSAFDPQSWNHFAYSSNDPINRIDPTGRSEFYENCSDVGITFVDGNCDNSDCAGQPNCNPGETQHSKGWGVVPGMPDYSYGSTPNPTGSCVYLNDQGTAVDNNGIDPNSSVDECNGTGGYFAPGQVVGESINPNSDAVVLQFIPNFGMIGVPTGTAESYQSGVGQPLQFYLGFGLDGALRFGNLQTFTNINLSGWLTNFVPPQDPCGGRGSHGPSLLSLQLHGGIAAGGVMAESYLAGEIVFGAASIATLPVTIAALIIESGCN
jgi:RHS repeat-associated protein